MPRLELTRLILVEDDPDIRKVVQVIFQSAGGLEFLICSSGEELLANASRFNPQLILLDVMMPGMDGISAFKALQKVPDLASVPVIFMTAKVQAAEIESYKKLGALDVIQKPFEPMSLVQLIRDIWKRRDV